MPATGGGIGLDQIPAVAYRAVVKPFDRTRPASPAHIA
jgi:hypothetical protein